MQYQPKSPRTSVRETAVLTAVLCLFVAAIALANWPQPTERRLPPPEAYRLPEITDDDLDERTRGVNAVARSFEHFDDFAKSVSKSRKIVLYEGLPHETWEHESYEREKAGKPTIELDKWPFYETPIALSSADESQLREMFTTRHGFIPYQGPKLCGGFHPDWCVVASHQDKQLILHFCFGCDEMTATDGVREMHCDIFWRKEFARLFEGYGKNRPQ